MQASLFDDDTPPHGEPAITEAAFLSSIPHIERVKNRHYETYDVYIGRGSRWGNPFKIGPDGDRLEVILKYRRHLWQCLREGSVTQNDLLSLQGRTLGCYCAPKPCHGHVLLMAIAWAERVAYSAAPHRDGSR